MSKCLTCSPRDCRPGYVYVVWDDRRQLSKIGSSVNMGSRMASYRANGNTHIALKHKQIAGCPMTSLDREDRAIRSLNSSASRVQGDWFDAPAGVAIECVKAACKGYSGARWK